MHVKIIAVAVAAGVAVLGAGCTSKQSGTAIAGSMSPEATTTTAGAPASTTSDEETTTTEAPPTNERGAIPKKLGEAAGWTDDGGAKVTFWIDKITVDPRCDEFGEKPKGHTVVLDIRVATGAPGSSGGDSYALLAGTINPYSFQVIGTDGVSKPADAGICRAGSLKELPTDYGPNQRYSGQIELDVPAKSGTLVLTQQMQDVSGWEWQY